MSTRVVWWVSLLLLLTLLAGPVLLPSPILHAQEPEPPPLPALNLPPRVDENADVIFGEEGAWKMASDQPARPAAVRPQDNGGPDDFGYVWDDSVAINWVDATNGKDTGMKGASRGQAVGPIPLPFPFKYYENTYSELFIAASGYVAFINTNNKWPSQTHVPSPDLPNSVIAPYSSPFELATRGKANRVYYKSGGAAPNRYFVVEWHKVVGRAIDGVQNEKHTFEVLLFENGDILFQYLTMTYGGDDRYCEYIGIEDATGLDGLRYSACDREIASNTAIRFTRPPASARAKFTPPTLGRLLTPNTPETFVVAVQNAGELGSDLFNIAAAGPWPTGLRSLRGGPLPDTNGDGSPDTGVLGFGQSATFLVDIQAPTFVKVGDFAATVVTANSTKQAGYQRKATIHLAVTPPFLHISNEYADRAVRALAFDPTGARLRRLDRPELDWINDTTVASLGDGTAFYAWNEYRYSPLRHWDLDIHYTHLTSSHERLYPPIQLTSNASPYESYNFEIAVAAAPDGSVGLLWRRTLLDPDTERQNWNIAFAIIDRLGNVAYGPVNLTNHHDLIDWTPDIDNYDSLRIAATGDNRFILAWSNWVRQGRFMENIDYTVRSTTGAEVTPITRYSSDSSRGQDEAREPTLTTLANNRIFLGYVNGDDGSFCNTILDSSGNEQRAPVCFDRFRYGFGFDSYQTANGSIVAAWSDWDWDIFRDSLMYMVLSSDGAVAIKAPTQLTASPSVFGDIGVSIAGDAAGRAVLTWIDDSSLQPALYTMSLDSSGNVLTPPMPFLMATGPVPPAFIHSSFGGYGAAPNTAVTPTTATMPDLAVAAIPLVVGQQSGVTGFEVQVSNKGLVQATNVTLSASLAPSLTFAGSSIPPVSVLPAAGEGGLVKWNLPNLAYLSNGALVVYTRLPSNTIGASYPVTLTLTTSSLEHNPNNSTTTVQVMEGAPLFLPVATRN